MKQQTAHEYVQTNDGQHLIQRRSLVPSGQGTYYQEQQANPHRVGHYAGFHPEDQPYLTDEDVETSLPARLTPRSAIRYPSFLTQRTSIRPTQGNRILASKDFTNSRLESWKHPRLLDFHLSRQLQYSSHLG